jgi:hypothetical protein
MNVNLTSKQNEQTPRQKNKPIDKNLQWMNYVLASLFFGGIILTVGEISIYRKTIIDWKIPTAIWVGVGLTSVIYLRRYLSHYTKNIFLQLVFSVCSLGGLLTYSFMATNYYFIDKVKTEVIKTPIIKIGYLAKGKNRCEYPYADVNIKGEEKELIFPCGFEIAKYKFVSVSLKRGLWGFDRILEQTPTEE